ncbi:hypothetical protein [Pseudomonas putida]|jgi:hypothetical protein|uniref:hypothetical protein n=1 Tax=Pseudomonas putida TaxID=303 RepID=UPI00062B0514|nr:hypothetical protein [Pseudomonas putida]KKX61181.1 hypothetical protein PU99_15085 [Pseudomonas putida]
MVEFVSTSLWMASAMWLTWAVFFIPSKFGLNISLPAKVVLMIPVAAVNIAISGKTIGYLKAVLGF